MESIYHPNIYELRWLDDRYAEISNSRQLRPHKEALLRNTSRTEESKDSEVSASEQLINYQPSPQESELAAEEEIVAF